MRKLYIGLFLLFLAASMLTAQEIPADAPQWNLTVWVNPPTSNTIAFVWIKSDGKLSFLGKNAISDRIEFDRQIEKASLSEIYKAASIAITTFVVHQEKIMTDEELSKVVDSTWSMGLELQVGNQVTKADDFVMTNLDERPKFKSLLMLINKELPEKNQFPL